jgi:hypothetical protein
MANNVFQFDNMLWIQTCKTSMGTSCACSYDTLNWAYVERKYILPKWSHSLPFLHRFIDDKFGIWSGSGEEFKLFLQDLNSYVERENILPKWSHSLLFLHRFIDDKFGIWSGSEQKDRHKNFPKTNKPSPLHPANFSTHPWSSKKHHT